jgi:xylose isomerase
MSEYAISTRLNSFRASPELFHWKYGQNDPRDLLARAEQIRSLKYISVNYPEHFPTGILPDMKTILRNSSLELSSINLRYPSKYSLGAFTHPNKETRQSAIDLTHEAIDLCKEFGGTDVILWLGPDGFDYPFQINYPQAWEWERECIKKIVEYANPLNIKISIEYKPCEPRKFSILGNFGMTMNMLQEINMPNLGITCDLCHMLIARESPAMLIALALSRGQLFALHLNDGYSAEDDGLAIGSVHFFQTLEIFYLLLKYSFHGIIYFDTFPINEDPKEEYLININRLENLFSMAKSISCADLHSMINSQQGLKAQQFVWDKIFFKEKK